MIDFTVEEVEMTSSLADNSYVQLGCFNDGDEGSRNLC